jgi:hypothetical protein
VLNDNLEDAFRHRYSGFRPTNDDQVPSESDSNRYCNTMTLKSMYIVPLRVPQTAARRRDISLTLAM